MRRKALSAAMASVALAAAVALAGCGGRTVVVADGQQANTITVSASSEVRVVPDRASFQVEVVVQGETAEEAQAAAADPVNAVLAALRAAGVEDKDIQTTYTDLSPLYDWSGEAERILGYEQRTNLQVRGVAVEDVSVLMEACVAAGASGVDGPSYYASSYDEAYAQALGEAVAATKLKAQALATASGVALGEVVGVTEGYQDTSYRYAKADMAMVAAEEADAGSMEIAPGEVTVTAQVTVVYAIG